MLSPPEVASPDLAPEPVEPAAVRTPAKGLSILVAEDNEINALLMRSLLGRLGHHAVITTNGDKVVSVADEPPIVIDVVASDGTS